MPASRTSSSTCSSRARRRDRRRDRAAGGFDRRPDRRLHVEGIRRLLPQGARRAPAARRRHPRRPDLAIRCSPKRTSSARRRSILEEIKMVEDTPDDLVHEIFAEGFWSDHPLGRPILGTPASVSALDQRDAAGATSRDTYVASNFVGRRGRQSRARRRAGAARSARSPTSPHNGSAGRRSRAPIVAHRRSRCARRSSSRATSCSAPRRCRSTIRIATPATRSTPRSAAR